MHSPLTTAQIYAYALTILSGAKCVKITFELISPRSQQQPRNSHVHYWFRFQLCYVALASPPRHQHLRCFHYYSK